MDPRIDIRKVNTLLQYVKMEVGHQEGPIDERKRIFARLESHIS